MLRQDTPSPKVFTGRKRVDKKNMLGVVIDKVSSTRVRAQTAVVCCRVVWTRLRRLYALLQFLPTLKRTTHNFVRLRRFQDAPVVLCNGESDSPVGPPDVARTRVNLDGNGKISNRHSTGEALGSNAATVVAPKRSSAPSMARLKRPSGGTDINSGVDSGFAASSGAGGGAEADGEDDAVPKRTARAATTIDLPPTIDPDGPELPNFADPDGPPIPDFSGGGDPDGPEIPAFGRAGGRGRGGGDGGDGGGDPDGPELPDFSSFGADGDGDGDVMDADDEQDMEDQASSRTRSRSSSFYNVGGDEESGDGDDMSQEDFDRMMEEGVRSGKAEIETSQRWYKMMVVALSSALWPHAHPTIPLTRRPSLTTAHTTITATSSTRAHAVELHDERA